MDYWICPSCGKKVAEKIKECPYCKAPKQQETGTFSIDNNSSKAFLVLMVLAIAVGAFLFWNKNSGSKQSAPGAVTQNNPAAPSPSTPPDQEKANVAQQQPKSEKKVPQSAIDAYNSLKKLEAHSQSGVIVKEYSAALGDAKFALNQFSASSEARNFPELSSSLNSAYETYKMAAEVWNDKFKENKRDDNTVSTSFHPDIFSKYPDAKKDRNQGGLTFSDLHGKEYMLIDATISYLFKQASIELEKTSKLMPQ